MHDPIHRVLESLPAPFFQQLQEYADAGFAEALTLVGRHVEEPEHANMLGRVWWANPPVPFLLPGQRGLPPETMVEVHSRALNDLPDENSGTAGRIGEVRLADPATFAMR
jgi:hypothetical protein